MPMIGQRALGMKLHTMNRIGFVMHAHDCTPMRLVHPSVDFQTGRQVFNHQAVIARCRKIVGQARKHTRAIMGDARDFAVHQILGSHDFCAKRLTDALMTKTHAQQRNARAKCFNHCHRKPSLERRARTR